VKGSEEISLISYLYSRKVGTRPSTTQSHNLLENFWPLSILVPISLARW